MLHRPPYRIQVGECGSLAVCGLPTTNDRTVRKASLHAQFEYTGELRMKPTSDLLSDPENLQAIRQMLFHLGTAPRWKRALKRFRDMGQRAPSFLVRRSEEHT